MLGLISVMMCLAVSLVNGQYTCPSSQSGIMVSGTGLGGINGYYQAKSQAECCYNCFVVNQATCAGYSFFAPQNYCLLVSSIALTVPNVGSSKLILNTN